MLRKLLDKLLHRSIRQSSKEKITFLGNSMPNYQFIDNIYFMHLGMGQRTKGSLSGKTFNQQKDRIFVNVLRAARTGCTPHAAIGPIPFMTTHKPTPSDCHSCKFFSGNQLLKCAVNPKRMMDDDCAEFEKLA